MTSTSAPKQIPSHVAIVMDGNGRWAESQGKKRTFGHKAGLDTVRNTVEKAIQFGIKELTLFAFSSENWNRPEEEVSMLMTLFVTALEREVAKLHKNGVRIRFIGDTNGFSEKLKRGIASAEKKTGDNQQLFLNIAANYGGRWEISEAFKKLSQELIAGNIRIDEIDEQTLSRHFYFHDSHPPDLFIRTGGECRVSNFLLWHLAYCELYFTNTLWPDFDKDGGLKRALEDFATRQRRFGKTGQQISGTAQGGQFPC
ncbi:MAG: polyprenyl diphosphate synthase [Pseudomonadota bacterium]